jgi:hypothetical protein
MKLANLPPQPHEVLSLFDIHMHHGSQDSSANLGRTVPPVLAMNEHLPALQEGIEERRVGVGDVLPRGR